MSKKPRPQQPPETDHAATHADEFAGQGGSYEIRNGKRVLVERTKSPDEAQAESGRRAGSDE